ncbi:MAG TPA: hypothetical protein PLY87_13415 [Planctomycetaceae bacterium]|nr:hypothetical protein [Planctomycetaceae bacterium]
MADLSQTASSVAISGSKAPTKRVQFGEAVTQGMPVYLSDSKYYKADANDTVAKAAVEGIVLTPAGIDGYGMIAVPSDVEGVSLVNLGATLTVGIQYAPSATAGAVCPITDISSGQFPTSIGFAISSSLLDFKVTTCSVAKT